MTTSNTFTFAVTGMHCGSCGMLIDETLEDVPGVAASATSVRKNTTVVTADPAQVSPQQIIAAIRRAGYDATWENA